ncbi:MAG TPA: hypothetical protein PKW95_09240 [bacterium]|nr:hypothetical protein [bacterium]
MRARWIFVLAALLLAAACDPTAVKPDVKHEGSYRSYQRLLDNWTRSDKIYRNFETHLIVSATYFSESMRRGYVAEYARAFDLPADETDFMLEEQLNKDRRDVEFIIVWYTPRMRDNDLDDPDSSWRLWFIDADGVKVGASQVKRLRVRHTKEYFLFPEYNEWSRLYRVTFPAVGPDGQALRREEGKVKLRVAGVEGSFDLIWDMTATQ